MLNHRPDPASALLAVLLIAPPAIAAASDWSADELDAFAEPIDLRLGVGSATRSYRVENLDAGTVSDERFAAPLRLTFGWVGSTGIGDAGGWLWGLGTSFTDLSGGDLGDGRELHLMTWAVRAQLGYGWAVGRRVRLEILPSLGFGRAFLRAPAPTTSDSYTEWGLDLDAVRTWRSGIQLGVTVGYLGYDSDLNQGDPSTRYNFSAHEVVGGIILGYRM